MRYSWRWYGPNDPVKIGDVAQTGANEVVSALHHIPNGEVWPIEEIQKRQEEVRWNKEKNCPTYLRWTVVESVPVHEDIKKRTGNYKEYIENYKQSLRNLSACGINIVVYNFMPVLDWTRTDLAFELPNGCKCLKFDEFEFAAFELFILKRDGAFVEYDEETIKIAKSVYDSMSDDKIEELTRTVIAGLPGAEESFTLEEFKDVLDEYKDISADTLRSNLIEFLKEVIPVAEECGINMAIHPDDPPRPILGLPRVMSNINDIKQIAEAVPSLNCGFNICAGSFGVNEDNNIPEMIREFGERVHFVHLRSVLREGNSFMEDEHIKGSVNLVDIISSVINEEKRRKRAGVKEFKIPIRSDHGHQMLDDLDKKTNPGYSCIGRMKGLAEIKGIELALKSK